MTSWSSTSASTMVAAPSWWMRCARSSRRRLRLSNYLIWQAAYAEYYSTATLWPDFGEADLVAALDAYASRKRRFGKTDAQVAAESNAENGNDTGPAETATQTDQ